MSPDPVLPPGVSNPQPPPKSPIEGLALAVVHFPEFVFNYVMAMVFAALTDVVVFSLVVGSAVLAVLVGSPLLGVAVFFLTYVLLRITNNLASAIGSVGYRISGSVANLRPPQGHPLDLPPSAPE